MTLFRTAFSLKISTEKFRCFLWIGTRSIRSVFVFWLLTPDWRNTNAHSNDVRHVLKTEDFLGFDSEIHQHCCPDANLIFCSSRLKVKYTPATQFTRDLFIIIQGYETELASFKEFVTLFDNQGLQVYLQSKEPSHLNQSISGPILLWFDDVVQ